MPELLASLVLDRPDEHAIFAFMERADALGGPRFAVSIPNGIPTGWPFYTRSEQPPSTPPYTPPLGRSMVVPQSESAAPAPQMDRGAVSDPDDEASRAPLPKREGQVIILRCRTPEEAYLLIQELAQDDIIGILPEDEIKRYRSSGGGYVEIQVSAAAYDSATELQKVVEFHHQVVRALEHLPFALRLVAFVLGVLICPGLLALPLVYYDYRRRGYERMAEQALHYYLWGLALGLTLLIMAVVHR